MTKVRILPHRTAASDAVHWGAWWVRMGGKRLPVEDRLKGWDYATAVTFELQPTVDLELLMASTGIQDPSAFELLALLDCPATNQRFIARRMVEQTEDDESNILALEPPPGEIADVVRLSAHVVLARSLPESTDGAATRVGSRLGQTHVHTLRLEGEASRFPTEAVAFSAIGLESAAWTMQCKFTDLDDSFLGGVRLLVNTEHPASELLLDSEAVEARAAQSMLRMDVARQLLLHVALDPNLIVDTRREWPEGSVRYVLETMTDLFLGMNLATTLEFARGDLVGFERRLQDRFELLKGIN